MKQIPKYIHPKNKAAYERLLKLCDDRAKQLGGRIYAIVDYENCEARIELTLPFVEFSEDGEHAFLQYAAQHTSYICFAPSVDGQSIVMKMYVDYFEDVPLGLLDEATLRRADERACEQALKALDLTILNKVSGFAPRGAHGLVSGFRRSFSSSPCARPCRKWKPKLE